MASQEVPGNTKNKLSKKQKITNLVGVSAIVVIIGGALFLARTNAANAEVGDCVKESGSKGLKQVGCDTADAQFKVVGRIGDKGRDDATMSACKDFQGVSQVYWEGTKNKGFVLCLADAK
ncbi:hypothetical protein OG474_00765 [Kribbella sp. NBC_01505]|uniref:LppU/SCO3897 family protein n=1 Tax=Kribbella sp. NBC_01505 TaxID=2903580 RepID=UPI0038686E88